MADELTYLDLIVLRKVDAEATVEKFGSQINTSFFETANILGTMKIKGLVDIQSSIGGASPLVVTGTGQDVLATAMQKAAEPLDTLDQAILKAIGGGARDLAALQGIINLRSLDLALHLHKLKSQDYIEHEVRSGRVMLSLTEKGFILTGGAVMKSAPPAAGAKTAVPASAVAAPKPAQLARAPASGSEPAAPNDIQDILAAVAKPEPKAPVQSKLAAPAGLAASIPVPVAQVDETPRGLDRQAMLFSKLEYYAKQYLPYFVLFVLLVVFVAYALLMGMSKPAA